MNMDYGEQKSLNRPRQNFVWSETNDEFAPPLPEQFSEDRLQVLVRGEESYYARRPVCDTTVLISYYHHDSGIFEGGSPTAGNSRITIPVVHLPFLRQFSLISHALQFQQTHASIWSTVLGDWLTCMWWVTKTTVLPRFLARCRRHRSNNWRPTWTSTDDNGSSMR